MLLSDWRQKDYCKIFASTRHSRHTTLLKPSPRRREIPRGDLCLCPDLRPGDPALRGPDGDRGERPQPERRSEAEAEPGQGCLPPGGHCPAGRSSQVSSYLLCTGWPPDANCKGALFHSGKTYPPFWALYKVSDRNLQKSLNRVLYWPLNDQNY